MKGAEHSTDIVDATFHIRIHYSSGYVIDHGKETLEAGMSLIQ